jgi:hypothetical protein
MVLMFYTVSVMLFRIRYFLLHGSGAGAKLPDRADAAIWRLAGDQT